MVIRRRISKSISRPLPAELLRKSDCEPCPHRNFSCPANSPSSICKEPGFIAVAGTNDDGINESCYLLPCPVERRHCPLIGRLLLLRRRHTTQGVGVPRPSRSGRPDPQQRPGRTQKQQ